MKVCLRIVSPAFYHEMEWELADAAGNIAMVLIDDFDLWRNLERREVRISMGDLISGHIQMAGGT